MSNDEDVIGELVALGVIVLIGVGLYKIISSFGSFENGDEATKKEVLKMNRTQSGSVEKKQGEVDICDVCGTESPERCNRGHCITCHGECACGNCLACSGAGGSECNVCSTDPDD